jgi:hypothetical protein
MPPGAPEKILRRSVPTGFTEAISTFSTGSTKVEFFSNFLFIQFTLWFD